MHFRGRIALCVCSGDLLILTVCPFALKKYVLKNSSRFLDYNSGQVTGIVKIFLNFHCWSLSWMLFGCWDYWQTDWLLKEKDGDLWTEVCLYMFKITNRQTEMFSFAILRFCRYYWDQKWDNIELSIFPTKIKVELLKRIKIWGNLKLMAHLW